jgi:hypothetical protein
MIVLLVAADLLWFRITFGTAASDDAAPRSPPTYAATVDRGHRVFSLVDMNDLARGAPWREFRETLPPDMGAAWALDSPDGTTSTAPAEFHALFDDLHPYAAAGADRMRLAARHLGRLQITGVGYVITRPEWGRLPWRLVHDGPLARVWEVPGALPQAFLSSTPHLDDPRWRAAFVDPDPSDASAALLENLRASTVGSVEPLAATDSDTAAFAVESGAPATFVRTTRLEPDWHAELDGHPVAIAHALGFFQSVSVPSGRHVVRFAYRPRALGIGLGISLASLASAALLAGSDLYRRRRSAKDAADEDRRRSASQTAVLRRLTLALASAKNTTCARLGAAGATNAVDMLETLAQAPTTMVSTAGLASAIQRA